MSRASTVTLLALDRYAQILGIAGPFFNQAAGTSIFPVPACGHIFFQWEWQRNDRTSREEIARSIKRAEDDITDVLGYSPGPVWIEEEILQYPQHYRPDVFPGSGLNVRNMRKSVTAKLGKFIEPGQRATAEVASGVNVVYSDEDGDGYSETATISTATTLTARCEIKCYFAGEGGNQEWEIRPARSVTLAAGTITFTFWAWQLLDPDLWEAFPDTVDGLSAIALETAGNYVATVDIYREYTDTTATSAQFYWENEPVNRLGIAQVCPCSSCGGTGCEACSYTTQTGCLHTRNTDAGELIPQPATYNDDTGEWDQSFFSICRDPDFVKVWYRAGNIAQQWITGKSCDMLDDKFAYAIAYLATARMDRELCSCNSIKAMANKLMEDMAYQGEASYLLSEAELNNPFGTRRGEIEAWRRIGRMVRERNQGVAAV